MTKTFKLSAKERAKGREYVKRHRDKLRAAGHKISGSKSYNATIARLFVDRFLSEHPCVDCRYSDPRALEFDHVRGQKVFEISLGVVSGVPLPVLMEEIEKCDVRCANCHRLRHSKK